LSDPTVRNPTVSLRGTYTLTATDRGNGCSGSDSVVVIGDNTLPATSAGADKQLTCTTVIVQLDGSATGGDGSQGYTYSWSPGGPLDDSTSQAPHTSTAGTYTLTATAVATGCSSTDAVTV